MTENYSESGDENLAALDEAHRFTEWMYSEISPYLHGDILEIGSGRGTYSKKVVEQFPNAAITLSDIDTTYEKLLSEMFSDSDHVNAATIDISRQDELEKVNHSVDSAFALNVLEHIEHDQDALKNMYDFLEPGGHFVVLVPAHMRLFNSLDRAVDHFRRYSKSELKEKAEEAGFTVEKIHYFNFFAIPGWFINGNLLKKNELNGGAISVFNTLVPLFQFFERVILRRSIGISLIAVLRKD